jgi:hypothetical protein
MTFALPMPAFVRWPERINRVPIGRAVDHLRPQAQCPRVAVPVGAPHATFGEFRRVVTGPSFTDPHGRFTAA